MKIQNNLEVPELFYTTVEISVGETTDDSVSNSYGFPDDDLVPRPFPTPPTPSGPSPYSHGSGDTSNGPSDFQAKLRANGNIVLTWGDMEIGGGIVGLSSVVSPTDISTVV